MKKTVLLSLSLFISSQLTVFAAPLGAPPEFGTTKKAAPVMRDGQSIVLGKYASRQDADSQLSALLDFMDGSSKIVNLELENGFDYAVKKENGRFVVSIEPFVNETVLNDVLVTVRSQYPKAHAEDCIACVREEFYEANRKKMEEEVFDDAIALDESKQVKVAVEEDAEEPGQEESINKDGLASMLNLPFDTKYLLYGVGGLALLLLIFLLKRKPKKTSDKELRAMYAQAKALEKELAGEEVAKTSAEETPETPKKASVASTSEPVVEKPTPKPEPKVATPVETPPVAPEVAKSAPEAKPAASAPTSHKLREPNKSVSSITKENFKEFAGLRLLIAEDNLINQKVIVGLLKDSGINIKIANDGQECMDILAEDAHYPIILMDAHMPRVDGLEATRLIRANPDYDHITVMALSGDTGADDVRKMREAGMEEQLEKPLKISALYQALYCYFDPNTLGGAEDALPEIHLDNSLGLEMLGGDIELYHEILSEFESLYHDSDEKIELWIKHGDIDRAKAILLDVKGIGESIGTAELTETAEEFREALIAGDTSKYSKLMKRYRSQLKSILADIAEV